ncbi:TOBE domain-containing protein, partial [Sulfurihydrogenibium sp.]
ILESFVTADTISNLKIKTELGEFYCLVLETPQTADYIKVGKNLKLLLKEGDFILTRERIYPFNSFEAKVKEVEVSEILVRVKLTSGKYEFVALITKQEFEHLSIKPEDYVFLFVKATNIILEV